MYFRLSGTGLLFQVSKIKNSTISIIFENRFFIRKDEADQSISYSADP